MGAHRTCGDPNETEPPATNPLPDDKKIGFFNAQVAEQLVCAVAPVDETNPTSVSTPHRVGSTSPIVIGAVIVPLHVVLQSKHAQCSPVAPRHHARTHARGIPHARATHTRTRQQAAGSRKQAPGTRHQAPGTHSQGTTHARTTRRTTHHTGRVNNRHAQPAAETHDSQRTPIIRNRNTSFATEKRYSTETHNSLTKGKSHAPVALLAADGDPVGVEAEGRREGVTRAVSRNRDGDPAREQRAPLPSGATHRTGCTTFVLAHA